jgi:CheY-like chemotaxis protein
MEFRVTACPLKVNGELLTTLVLTDITSEKRREVLEQTFLHDLLNSLGGIEGWSQMLRESNPQLAAEKIMSLAAALREEVVAHRILVDAEQGALDVHEKPCRTMELLQTLDATFESHAVRAEKQLSIELPAQDLTLMTDRALLSRVLVNMVKNACEATPPGGCVKVWFEKQGDRPAFVVENDGTIPETVQPHIFERAFSTKARKGRGIGTYSMKLLGERFLKGNVNFSCATGTTRFWIALPAPAVALSQVPSKAPAAKVEGLPQTGSARRILFVEDDHSLARLGSLFLKRIGCVVTTCRDGTEAAEAFEKSPAAFDLVITDAQMPGLSGFELVKKIHEACPGFPVLLCTGSHVSSVTLDEYGFRGVLLKPYSAASFSEALDTILAKASSRGSRT